MRFDPADGHETQDFRPLPAGRYRAIVTDATERESNGAKTRGQLYIRLELEVAAGDGGRRKVWDNLAPWATWMIKQYCDATGRLDQYEAGSLRATDLVGDMLEVQLDIEDGNDGYAPRNTVVRYMPGEARGQTRTQSPAAEYAEYADGDIPF